MKRCFEPRKTCRETQGGITIVNKWECTVCGYIYNPDEGDPNGGVKPGTAFEDLPEGWVCPLCGVPKNMFRELNN